MRTASKNELCLRADEIALIITTCGKSGIRSFEYGALKFEMGPVFEADLLPLEKSEPVDHVRQNQDTLRIDEEQLREEQLRMLMIENPVAYEQQLRDGELEDEPGESDQSE